MRMPECLTTSSPSTPTRISLLQPEPPRKTQIRCYCSSAPKLSLAVIWRMLSMPQPPTQDHPHHPSLLPPRCSMVQPLPLQEFSQRLCLHPVPRPRLLSIVSSGAGHGPHSPPAALLEASLPGLGPFCFNICVVLSPAPL